MKTEILEIGSITNLGTIDEMIGDLEHRNRGLKELALSKDLDPRSREAEPNLDQMCKLLAQRQEIEDQLARAG